MITSRAHPLVKLARSLHLPKARREEKLFLAEGRNAVEAALAADWPMRALLCSPQLAPDWEARAEQTAFHVASDDVLESVADSRTSPGLVALCELPPAPELPTHGLTLVLDGVSDPGNVGTLIRAADASGASAVLLTLNSADPRAPKAVRASAGSVFHLPVVQSDTSQLQARQLPIIAAVSRDGESCFDFAWPHDCALVLGHETRGIAPELEAQAHHRVSIPMFGRAESLNVATAGAVLLFAWRQRQSAAR